MLSQIRPALVLFSLLTALTGVIYPAVVTGIAKIVFAKQAEGSLIERDGKVVGSSLIAQSFTEPKYFWPRPSAAGYNGASSSGSNLGPSNPALLDAVKSRIAALRAIDPGNMQPIPVELVNASASGLDPHLGPAAIDYQLSRVAKARGIGVDLLRSIINAHTTPRLLGVLGEPTVNVIELNLELDHGPAPIRTTATTQQSSAPTASRMWGFVPESR